jgi:hypothetical protein
MEREIKVQENEFFLTKLVVDKDDKGFDVAKCQLVDYILGNKFSDYFLFENDFVATLALGLQPKQGLHKVRAKNETHESHFILLGA